MNDSEKQIQINKRKHRLKTTATITIQTIQFSSATKKKKWIQKIQNANAFWVIYTSDSNSSTGFFRTPLPQLPTHEESSNLLGFCFQLFFFFPSIFAYKKLLFFFFDWEKIIYHFDLISWPKNNEEKKKNEKTLESRKKRRSKFKCNCLQVIQMQFNWWT